MDSKSAKRSKISKDRFSELPDDVLAFSLSFLPVKEASRTSILSNRWRNLWKDSLKFSSKLVLDVIGMRGSPYSHEISDNRKLMAAERKKFVKWVNQMVQLDYGSLKTFRLCFELRKNSSYHIDKWISMAIAKGVDNFEIDFSTFSFWGDKPPKNNRHYTFSDGLFTRESGAFLKRLHLKTCILNPFDFKVFSSLLDLKLENVLVDQCIIAKVLTDCPNLEKLWLLRCYKQRCLTISESYLKLQEFTIISYELCDVKINARNLKKLEVWGHEINLSCVNVLGLSNLAMVCSTSKDGTSALSYALGKLSIDLPQLEKLLLVATYLEENKIPSRLPLYTNLKKLIIKVSMRSQSLWSVISLLHASPFLQWLELHLYPSKLDEKEFIAGQRPCDHPHHHLQQIFVTGFDGSSHEMEFMQYLFVNCQALQFITLENIPKLYDAEQGFYDADCYLDKLVAVKSEKLMLDRVEEQLMPVLPPNVHLVTV